MTSRHKVYRLLAVDDNDLNLGLFRLFLSQLGHDVTAVNNPFDAIELAKQSNFDLIFTDIQMPGMTGIEASQHFRANGFTGPIIAITAHLSAQEETKILESALNGVLIKPVTKQDLTRILGQCFPEGDNAPLEIRVEPAPYAVTNSVATRPTGVYDLDLALARSNDSKELAGDLLAALSDSLEEAAAALSGQPDLALVSQTLHKLSGGVRLTGAAELEAELEDARQQIEANSFEKDSILKNVLNKIHELRVWMTDNPQPFATND